MTSPPPEVCILNYFSIEQIDEIYIANGFHLPDTVTEDLTYEERILMEHTIVGASLDLSDAETEEIIIPGLDEAVIDAHLEPVFVESEDHLCHLKLNCNSCSICHEDYMVGDFVGKITCSHFFHKACIEPWLRTSNTCPLCRETALNF